ncbi:hypothetical protein OS493_019917 [Desmophyllum pertusum]|uniref:Uncharacterized protein n=1 Tax=Desmophyllum pertusum TaxID=174260 RepID=A0A9X0CM61_9CNID|nr:hypothetical protein OS493_019917 [Desmophyllum pertusum]
MAYAKGNRGDMIELVDGSTVYWYSQQRAYCSAFKNWSAYVNAAVDIFFSKDKLSSLVQWGMKRRARLVTATNLSIPLLFKQSLVGTYLTLFLAIVYFLNIL